ncbi:hypothetical protein GCM10009537_13620 [Corynebacterium riegelii]
MHDALLYRRCATPRLPLGLGSTCFNKYAGEDMQVPWSERFFNKGPVNENGLWPADLHIFPCISVFLGGARFLGGGAETAENRNAKPPLVADAAGGGGVEKQEALT